MQQRNGRLLFSPSDLSAFLACRHLARLELGVARGEVARPDVEDAQGELIRRKGDHHERAYLEALLADVEKEWGRADPTALPQEPYRTPAQRSDSGPADRAPTTFVGNTAGAGTGVQDVAVEDVATAGARAS